MKGNSVCSSKLLDALIRKLALLNLLLLPLPFFGATPPRYVEDELLVKFKGGPRGEPAAQAQKSFKHEVKRNFHQLGWQQIKLPAGQTVAEALARYQKHPDILAVQPNYLLKVQAFGDCAGIVPNDPRFTDQWALARIGATNAWCTTTGSHDVVVAVIDSGIDYNHEDLAANMWHNTNEIPNNAVDDDDNGYVDDLYGIDVVDHDGDPYDLMWSINTHGTAMAGIIGAVGNNGIGIAGVNWSVQLMALRILPSPLVNASNFVETIAFAEICTYLIGQKEKGVKLRVANHSYGLDGDPGPLVREAMEALDGVGILNVFAAGAVFCGTRLVSTNLDLAPVVFPQYWHLPNMINVASSDTIDKITSDSNWGIKTVDLAAPGVNILSTRGQVIGGSLYSSDLNGSSVACAYVAGAAALIAAQYPEANAGQIKAALMHSVDTNANLSDKVASKGRLNLGSAITNYDVLKPDAPPFIYIQPESQTNGVGCPVTFSVVASGPSSSRLAYQWQCNGNPIENATNATVVLSNPQAGNYQVLVMNDYGTATSASATLTLKDSPIVLGQPPQDLRVLDGTDVTLNVSVAGACPLNCQWQYNGTDLIDNQRVNGATSPTLVLRTVGTNDTGLYQLLIANSAGATSAVVSLTVLGMPWVVTQPRSQTVTLGADANFCVEFTNTASQPVRIRWFHNVTNASITVSLTNEYFACTNLQNIQTNMAGPLYMTMNNPATRITCVPSVPSSHAYLAVIMPPTSQTATHGGCVSFRAQAFGTNLAFQWQFNGTNLVDNERVSGATNSTLTVCNLQCSDAGLYLLIITNHDAEPAFFPAILNFPPTVQLVSCADPPHQKCLEICWCHGSGLPPQLQWTDNLSRPAPWPVWTGTVPPGPGWKCIRIPCNERMKFFRLVPP